jgi:hypothetical protein
VLSYTYQRLTMQNQAKIFKYGHSKNTWTMSLPFKLLVRNSKSIIVFCKNIYSMNVWNFIAIGQMDLILINFKTDMFCTHGAIVTSETKRQCNIFYRFLYARLWRDILKYGDRVRPSVRLSTPVRIITQKLSYLKSSNFVSWYSSGRRCVALWNRVAVTFE